MPTRRIVTASDVSTLRASAEMKPPTVRRRQAFHTSVITWSRSEINSVGSSLHLVSFSNLHLQQRASRYPPLLSLLGAFGYHQCSAWTPNVRPVVSFSKGTPPTSPRKPFDQLAYVTNARNTGRPKNLRSAPICGANVHLRNQPS
jgi:hypothetical protein